MRTISFERGVLSVVDEPNPDGGSIRARMFYKTASGWSPPLPAELADIEVPEDKGSRSARSGDSIIRSGGPCQLVARPRTRSRGGVEFRDHSPVPVTIRLTPQVRRQILEEVGWCSGSGGGFPDHELRESGGYLCAATRPTFDSVEFVLASGPGPDSRHARDGFVRSSVEQIEAQLFAERPRDLFVRCGDYHSHPDPVDFPSAVDMKAWTLRAQAATPLLSGWASLMVTPAERYGGWTYPRFSGFVTRHDGARWLCDRARVVEERWWAAA
jgi:hypothetical protein